MVFCVSRNVPKNCTEFWNVFSRDSVTTTSLNSPEKFLGSFFPLSAEVCPFPPNTSASTQQEQPRTTKTKTNQSQFMFFVPVFSICWCFCAFFGPFKTMFPVIWRPSDQILLLHAVFKKRKAPASSSESPSQSPTKTDNPRPTLHSFCSVFWKWLFCSHNPNLSTTRRQSKRKISIAFTSCLTCRTSSDLGLDIQTTRLWETVISGLWSRSLHRFSFQFRVPSVCKLPWFANWGR